MMDPEKESKLVQENLGKSYTDLWLERVYQKRKANLKDSVGVTAESQKLPPASLRGTETTEYGELEIKHLLEHVFDSVRKGEISKSEFDDILNRVFKPHGTDTFTNLRGPGMAEAKISASPGQSGSQTGRAGSGTSTFPNNQGARTDYYSAYDNPSLVPQGSGATRGFSGTTEGPVGTPREGSRNAGVGYQHPDFRSNNKPPSVPAYSKPEGGVSVKKSFRENIGAAFSTPGADITASPVTKAHRMEFDEEGRLRSFTHQDEDDDEMFSSGQAPQTGGNVQNETSDVSSGMLADEAEATARRFDEEEAEERRKFEESARSSFAGAEGEEAKKHANLAFLAHQRAQEIRKRLGKSTLRKSLGNSDYDWKK